MIDKRKIGEVIKSAREAKNYTQEELAEAIGMTQRMISSYERGKQKVSEKAARKLSRVLGLSVAYLQGYSENPYPEIEKKSLDYVYKKTIPVYESVSAGSGNAVQENKIGYIQSYDGDFAVKVKGDSMPPIPEDAMVVVKKIYDIRDVKSGSLVVVRINGNEAVLKYWFVEENYGVNLKSENINYKPIFIPWEKFYTNEAELIGLAIQVIIDTRNVNYNNI